MSFLRIFGCRAFVKVSKPHQKKLDDRALPAVFIGYEQGSKAWRFFDPASNRAIVSRDAVFEENTPWDWSAVENVDTSEGYTEFVIEHVAEEQEPVDIGASAHNAPGASPSPAHGGATPGDRKSVV